MDSTVLKVCKVDDRRTEAQCSVAAPGDPVSGLVAPLHYQCQLIHGATVSTLLVTTNIAQQVRRQVFSVSFDFLL